MRLRARPRVPRVRVRVSGTSEKEELCSTACAHGKEMCADDNVAEMPTSPGSSPFPAGPSTHVYTYMYRISLVWSLFFPLSRVNVLFFLFLFMFRFLVFVLLLWLLFHQGHARARRSCVSHLDDDVYPADALLHDLGGARDVAREPRERVAPSRHFFADMRDRKCET